MSCTIKIKKLWPYVGTCPGSEMKLPYTSLADGTYTVMLRFLSKVIRIEIAAVDGSLTMPTDALNESFYYEGQVLNSEGSVVLFNTDYDTFAFYTKILQ